MLSLEENKSPVACFSMVPSPMLLNCCGKLTSLRRLPSSHNIRNLATFPTLLLPHLGGFNKVRK